MTPQCILCNHVATVKINTLLRDGMGPGELRVWLKEHYPTEPIPALNGVKNHIRRHLDAGTPLRDIQTMSIDRRTGRLIDKAGQTVEAVGIVAALKTMITIGVANMMANPASITPGNTLEALKMLRQLGIDDDDPSMSAWQESVVQTTTTAVPIDDVIDVPEIDHDQSKD